MRRSALASIALLAFATTLSCPPARIVSSPTRIQRARAIVWPTRVALPRAPVPAAFHRSEHALCGSEGHPDLTGRFLGHDDLALARRADTSLLARVTRSAADALPAEYAPSDLVDVFTGSPRTPEACDPPGGQCLRREAAAGLQSLFAAMRSAGHEPWVHSAFRAYASQCGVFEKWSRDSSGGFCAATEQSALAGHSQHQLGTALDLFTRAWQQQGPVFRSGFACSPGGRWLAEHAWEHGFVMSYPLPPEYRSHVDGCWERGDIALTVDPRTGYRFEPWHYRFIGPTAAAAYHSAWLASGPGTGGEITLDQWLRRRAGLAGDPDLPVCDGCACGACTTIAPQGQASACGEQSLVLDARGMPADASGVAFIREVRVARRTERGASVQLDVQLDVQPNAVTQPPAMGLLGPHFGPAAGVDALAFVSRGPARAYPDLPRAVRLAVEPADRAASGAPRWPWRAAVADPLVVGLWNGANLYLPAPAGMHWVRMLIDVAAGTEAIRVALLRDGVPVDAPIEIPLPGA